MTWQIGRLVHHPLRFRRLCSGPSTSSVRISSVGPDAAARAARVAVALIFFINGALGASWFARIPAIQARLELSNGQLGLALLGSASGALPALSLAGWLIVRVGSKRVVTAATLLYCASVPLPFFAPNLPLLFLAIFAWGVANGAMDVAMNAQAVDVDTRYPRPIISSFHALFSIGAMTGAGASALLAGLSIGPRLHLPIVALLFGALALVVTRRTLPAQIAFNTRAPAFAPPSRALLALGAIAMFSFLCEGAMADWSAVYLRQVLATGAGVAGTGFAAFALAMAVSRLLGDRLTLRFGSVALVRGGGLLAAAGVTLALLTHIPALTLVGFALVGVGLSTIAPLAFGAAARTPGVAPGPGIAAVSTMGYLGFLSGPALIGGLASVSTLRTALLLLVALSLGVALLARAVARTREALN